MVVKLFIDLFGSRIKDNRYKILHYSKFSLFNVNYAIHIQACRKQILHYTGSAFPFKAPNKFVFFNDLKKDHIINKLLLLKT